MMSGTLLPDVIGTNLGHLDNRQYWEWDSFGALDKYLDTTVI